MFSTSNLIPFCTGYHCQFWINSIDSFRPCMFSALITTVPQTFSCEPVMSGSSGYQMQFKVSVSETHYYFYKKKNFHCIFMLRFCRPKGMRNKNNKIVCNIERNPSKWLRSIFNSSFSSLIYNVFTCGVFKPIIVFLYTLKIGIMLCFSDTKHIKWFCIEWDCWCKKKYPWWTIKMFSIIFCSVMCKMILMFFSLLFLLVRWVQFYITLGWWW